MKKSTLYILWACLFIICAGLGFIPEPVGFLRFLLTALSIGFFVPPALLLHLAYKDKDAHSLQLIRNLSVLSLLVTTVLLILNFLSVLSPALLGNILHWVLVIVSAPMICSGHWVLSLFFWACLLFVSLKLLKEK